MIQAITIAKKQQHPDDYLLAVIGWNEKEVATNHPEVSEDRVTFEAIVEAATDLMQEGGTVEQLQAFLATDQGFIVHFEIVEHTDELAQPYELVLTQLEKAIQLLVDTTPLAE